MSRLRVLVSALLIGCPSLAHAQGILDFLEQLSGPGPFNYGISLDARVGCLLLADHNADEQEKRIEKKSPNLSDEQKQAEKDKEKSLHVRPFAASWHRDLQPVATPDGSASTMEKHHPCAVRSDDVVVFFEARFAHASTDIRPLFADRPGEFVGHTNAYMAQTLMMRQIFEPAIAIGVGGGAIWWGGETTNRHPARLLLTPLSVDVQPIRLFKPQWGRVARAIVFHFQENAYIGSIRATDFNSESTSTYESHAEVFRSFGISLDWLALFVGK